MHCQVYDRIQKTRSRYHDEVEDPGYNIRCHVAACVHFHPGGASGENGGAPNECWDGCTPEGPGYKENNPDCFPCVVGLLVVGRVDLY